MPIHSQATEWPHFYWNFECHAPFSFSIFSSIGNKVNGRNTFTKEELEKKLLCVSWPDIKATISATQKDINYPVFMLLSAGEMTIWAKYSNIGNIYYNPTFTNCKRFFFSRFVRMSMLKSLRSSTKVPIHLDWTLFLFVIISWTWENEKLCIEMITTATAAIRILKYYSCF